MSGRAIVHVVDDDRAILDSLRFLLESAGYAVRTYDNPRLILGLPLADEGCILTDFQMPEMNGIALQEQLAAAGVRLPIIVMTAHGDISSAVRAMKAGAVDFLEKPFSDDQLIGAIEHAIEANRLALAKGKHIQDVVRRLAVLTVREREVLDHLIAGKSSKEIGQALGISHRTIDVHRARIFQKLGVDSLPELVQLVLTAQFATSARQ